MHIPKAGSDKASCTTPGQVRTHRDTQAKHHLHTSRLP
jgi:hypothetical protein